MTTAASQMPGNHRWTRVATTTDATDERPHGLSSNGVELVLLRTPAGLHAYEGRCPHQGALLDEGQLDRGILVCRNHGWRFDAETGRRLDGPECLRACAVRQEGNAIWVDVSTAESFATGPSLPSSLRRVEDPSDVERAGVQFGGRFCPWNYCEYDAPSVEAVYEHGRRAGLPISRVTEIALEINPDMFM